MVSDDVAFAAVAIMQVATGLFVLAAVVALMSIVWGTNARCTLGAKRASTEFGITFRRAVGCLLGGIIAMMFSLLLACSSLAYGARTATGADNSGANKSMGDVGDATVDPSAHSSSKAAVLAVLLCVVTTLLLAYPARDAARCGYRNFGGFGVRQSVSARGHAPLLRPKQEWN